MKLTVVVTVYNEKDTILKAIEQAKELKVEKQIIVVDNCSTDGTREILRGIKDDSLEIVYQSMNYGYGRSVITGMNLAKGQYMYVHNSDLEYDPTCVYEMLELAEKESLDAIFGSRLLLNRRNESKLKILKERPFYLGTFITTFLTNLFYHKNFTDIIGNRFYRTAVLREIDPQIYGIGFDFEVVNKLCKYGYRIKEIPIKYTPRTKGKKIKAIDIIPAILTMLKIKFMSKKESLIVNINQADIKRILIIRTDRFGEFILNLPAIRAVRQNFPSAYICIMVNKMVREIIDGNSDVDEVIVYDEKDTRGSLETFRLMGEIKKRNFDLAIMLNSKKKFNIITFLAGIKVRLGYDRKWGFLLTHKIEDRKSSGQKHEVEYNLDLVRRIGIDTQDKSLFVSVDKEDEQFIDSLLKGLGIINTDLLIALHPWTSDSLKQWPVENFSRLAQRLLKEFQCRVIIIGGKEEIDKSINFCQGNPDLINLTGKLTLGQSAALFKKCRLLISNDSGPVHLACAVGTPVVALFRNDIPAKSARRWGPWGEGHIVIEKPNLCDIKVEEVLEKIKEKLKI